MRSSAVLESSPDEGGNHVLNDERCHAGFSGAGVDPK